MAEYQPRDFSTIAYHAYDAVWTLALGVNRYVTINCRTIRYALKFDTCGWCTNSNIIIMPQEHNN